MGSIAWILWLYFNTGKTTQKMKTQTLKFSPNLFLHFPGKKVECHLILKSKVTVGPAEATELTRTKHLKVSNLNKHTDHNHGVFLKH